MMLAWFAYLQATPGLILVYLRSELDLTYSEAGLHVAAFAAGSIIAGLAAAHLERAVGRSGLLWLAAFVASTGAIGLAAGRIPALTIGAVLVMGVGCGFLLVTVQAILADHHGPARTVAIAEANLAASTAYVVLIGALSLTALLRVGWRAAIVVAMLVPIVVWFNSRRLPIDTPQYSEATSGRLPPLFWIAVALLFCTTAAEWCITAWGATFVGESSGVSADTAVVIMAAFFSGVLGGRVFTSQLARHYSPSTLLAFSLIISSAGFWSLWASSSPLTAALGLALLGVGLGNLFPMGVALALSLVPGRSGPASGRIVAVTSLATLLAPLTVGTVADTASLRVALIGVPVLTTLASLGLALLIFAGQKRKSTR